MKFSIIIPVYNAEKYLRMCLDSVLAQTERDWECICVDDGSTDGSAAILDEYAAKESRFRVIHKKNEGVCVARNVALGIAQGEWISCLDADDEYAPWRLEEARRIIEREKPDLVRFRTRMSYEKHAIGAELARSGVYSVFDGDEAKKWCWDALMPAGMTCCFVAKRELFEGNGFIPGMRVKEECSVCARIATRVGRVVQSEAVAYIYRLIETSAMQARKTADECISFLDVVGRLMKEDCFSEKSMSRSVYEAMRWRMRTHCESDIVDWVRSHADSFRRGRDIRKAYLALKSAGVFRGCGRRRGRYAPALWWWDLTGQMWIIKAVATIESIIRKARR